MNIHDTLLDLDLRPIDCLYRFRREKGNTKRVIYVHVIDIGILPEESRTSNDELVPALSKLNGWYDKWDTLTISKLDDDEVRCVQDLFQAHALPPEKVLGEEYPFFDILDLRTISSKKPRVTYVDAGSELCYLKIARFDFELEWISRELEAYHALVKANILITSQGVKFIDFENSVSQPHEDLELWNAMKEQEACNLKANLMDSSNMGQPWD